MRLITRCTFGPTRRVISPSPLRTRRLRLLTVCTQRRAFACEESFAIAHGWPRTRLDRISANAIRKASSLAPAGTECDQIAIFDPEAEQWHFVSAEPLDSL